MDKLLYALVWLTRIFRCRGFGIQSPTDYRFVRYVINEHWPYYKYSELGLNDSWQTRRLGLLYFRLANWRQPTTIFSSAYHDYLQAGCATSRLVADTHSVEFAILSTEEELRMVLPNCADGSVLVLDRLYQHRTLWQQIVSDPRATITYDLFYCGIALFDPQRVKQHYIVNF